MKELRIIVTGSSDFDDEELLINKLDDIRNNILLKKYNNVSGECIISGAYKTVDKLGEEYAHANGIPMHRFCIDVDTTGRGVTRSRNIKMVDWAIKDDNYGVLIAFWDGKSPATDQIIKYATSRGLDIYIV